MLSYVISKLTFGRLLQSGPPVFMWYNHKGGRAFGFSKWVLGNHANRAIVVFANLRDLQNVDHAVVTQLEAVTLWVGMNWNSCYNLEVE